MVNLKLEKHFEPDVDYLAMRLLLSFFSEQNGNAMTVEGKIQQIVSEGIWPIILITEAGVELETCHNEQELRVALQSRGLL